MFNFLMPHDVILALVLAAGWVEVELLLVLAELNQWRRQYV